ncbi:MAG: class B sortase [Lachnospiraceae bacterium]|nr:class B sortase [Lachnospiraceae bacterium]
MNNKIRMIIILIAVCGIVAASVMLFSTLNEYKKGVEEYEGLKSYTTIENNVKDDSIETDIKNNTVEEEQEKREFKRNFNRDDYPEMEIDHSGLRKVNGDYIGWIYVGAADISYPVVQGKDNEYYLHNTFEKEANFAGCIFIDCEDKADMTMYNTFFYGHAMKNGTMFGNLRKLRKDPGLVKNDPYIYVYLEDGIYRYRIYSYYIDNKDSEMYYSSDTVKEYRRYIRNALDKSMAQCEEIPDEERNSVTLVTCQGNGSQKQRFFVHGIFIDRYLYE